MVVNTNTFVVSSGSINAANSPESGHVTAQELEPPTRQGCCWSYSKCMLEKKRKEKKKCGQFNACSEYPCSQLQLDYLCWLSFSY